MTLSATIVTSSDALVDVRSQTGARSDAQLGQVTEVGRAVYDLKVSDWVYIVPGLSRDAGSSRSGLS